jgi:hypothetical protein
VVLWLRCLYSAGRHSSLPWSYGGWPEASASAWGIIGFSHIEVTKHPSGSNIFLRVRYAGSGRRTDFLGRYTSRASSEHGQGRRPTFPRDGGLWAHMGWILTGRTLHNNSAELLPYVPDLRKDKFQVWISRWHWMPITAVGAIILVAGGWQYALWGIFFRTVIGLHSTWLVNSATHIWGTQRFPAHDPPKTAFGWRY